MEQESPTVDDDMHHPNVLCTAIDQLRPMYHRRMCKRPVCVKKFPLGNKNCIAHAQKNIRRFREIMTAKYQYGIYKKPKHMCMAICAKWRAAKELEQPGG